MATPNNLLEDGIQWAHFLKDFYEKAEQGEPIEVVLFIKTIVSLAIKAKTDELRELRRSLVSRAGHFGRDITIEEMLALVTGNEGSKGDLSAVLKSQIGWVEEISATVKQITLLEQELSNLQNVLGSLDSGSEAHLSAWVLSQHLTLLLSILVQNPEVVKLDTLSDVQKATATGEKSTDDLLSLEVVGERHVHADEESDVTEATAPVQVEPVVSTDILTEEKKPSIYKPRKVTYTTWDEVFGRNASVVQVNYNNAMQTLITNSNYLNKKFGSESGKRGKRADVLGAVGDLGNLPALEYANLYSKFGKKNSQKIARILQMAIRTVYAVFPNMSEENIQVYESLHWYIVEHATVDNTLGELIFNCPKQILDVLIPNDVQVIKKKIDGRLMEQGVEPGVLQRFTAGVIGNKASMAGASTVDLAPHQAELAPLGKEDEDRVSYYLDLIKKFILRYNSPQQSSPLNSLEWSVGFTTEVCSALRMKTGRVQTAAKRCGLDEAEGPWRFGPGEIIKIMAYAKANGSTQHNEHIDRLMPYIVDRF